MLILIYHTPQCADEVTKMVAAEQVAKATKLGKQVATQESKIAAVKGKISGMLMLCGSTIVRIICQYFMLGVCVVL
jgi:hypothetical protein